MSCSGFEEKMMLTKELDRYPMREEKSFYTKPQDDECGETHMLELKKCFILN